MNTKTQLTCLALFIATALAFGDEHSDDGHVVAKHALTLEGAKKAGANVSIGKAHTAAIFKKRTKDFEDAINKGRFTMTALPDFTPLQGGVPIVHDGHVIGAIGVSGAKNADQDEEIAEAGAAVFAPAKAPAAR